jgi:hypothetical protein
LEKSMLSVLCCFLLVSKWKAIMANQIVVRFTLTYAVYAYQQWGPSWSWS